MVVGPGEADRWLELVLEQRKKLVDDMVICQNNTDEKTRKIIKDSGFWSYEDSREWGVDQPRIKQDLLKRVGRLQPDWILPSDADELYDDEFDKDALQRIAQIDVLGYLFLIINLWGDEEHYNHTRSFWNVRFWNYKKARDLSLRFSNKNVHCGLAPELVYTYAVETPYMVKHYGLMTPEDRKKKVERYKKYDPNARFKGEEYYNSINDDIKTNDLIRKFDVEEMRMRVKRDVEKYGTKIRPIQKSR